MVAGDAGSSSDVAELPQLRDGRRVAAWIFKARPDVWDVVTAVRDGSGLESWRMAPSYRVALVAPGHPCALWVTGPSSGRHIPGVWAIGEVTSDPFDDAGDPDDELWLDVGARRQVRPHVMVHLRVLEAPIPRSVLRADPRFADSEILVAPRVASPVAVRPAEWAAILDLDPGPASGFRPEDQAQ